MNSIETLVHHGILGMKWGVRRYQNKDGTLTEKGKSRRKKSSSLKDLQKRFDRLKMERELISITDEEINPAKKFIMDVLKDVGKRTIQDFQEGKIKF